MPQTKASSLAETESRRRAPALAPHDRRQMIVDAVVPLLAEHGADLTSRQIAEAVGVAEGTIFRAFGDKESLLNAAAERFFDEETVLVGLRAIEPTDDLEQKVAHIVTLMRNRFEGAIRVMSALGGRRPQVLSDSKTEGRDRVARLIDEIFAPDANRLAWPPSRIVQAVRLLAFASSVPEVSGSDVPLSDDELARLLVGGILLDPRQAAPNDRESA